MNSRERQLAIATGAVVGLLLLFFLYQSVDASLEAARRSVAEASDQLEGKQRKLLQAKKAVRKLREYEAKSLPPDGEVARSLYQNWLLERLEAHGFRDVKLSVTGLRNRVDAFQLHTFIVSCRGNLAQLTRFMHDLYSVDRLTRVRRLALKPINDSKDLDVGFSVEALSLKGGELKDRLAETPSSRLAQATVTDYEKVIVGRNLFAPENRPPKISGLSSQRGYPQTALRFGVKAEDPDKLDQITYTLAEGAPDGARIDAKSGDFSWTPKQKGDFTATVVVTDNGLPSRSDKYVVKIAVVDPPPPPPPPKPEPPMKPKLDFDDAKFTFVSALLEVGDRWEAWFTVRTSGQVRKLRAGDKLAVGSIEGKVIRVDADQVEIETPEQRFVVGLGDNLLQGKPLAAASPRLP